MMITRPVDSAQVAAIVALEDPVVRNLWITHAYHEWGVALAGLMGGDDGSWCAFGTWASKSAGQTIRGDELPGALRQAIAHSEELDRAVRRAGRLTRVLGWMNIVDRFESGHLMKVADGVADEISGRIAEGNLLVFAELGPILAGLVDAFEASPRPAAGDRDAVIEPLLAAHVPSEVDPALLRQALTAWWGAIFDTDPDARCQNVLEGNIAAVLHEQQRLQPAIAGALDAAMKDGFVHILHDVIEVAAFNRTVHALLDRALAPLTAELERHWHAVATDELMLLTTSDEALRLGRDLPALAGVAFPPELVELADPGITGLWAAWNRARPDLRGSGAKDWTVLEQRMNYIVNLFRSRQRHPRLLDAPYSDAQLAVMGAGRVPPGPL
jgi:hypothetical protein